MGLLENTKSSTGLAPACRKGASCALLDFSNGFGTHFLAFGGQVSSSAMRNDTWLHKLNPNDHWLHLQTYQEGSLKKSPHQRWKSSLVSLPDRSAAYLFGGSDVVGVKPDGTMNEVFYNDVWKFDASTVEWELILDNSYSNETSVPFPRRAHSAVLFGNEEMLIFGGKDVTEQVHKDAWLFNFTSHQFTEVKTTNEFPGLPRKGHSAVSYNVNGGDYMTIYGGRVDDFTYLGDLIQLRRENGEFTWELLYSVENREGVLDEDYPGPRNHHSAVYHEGKMVVYGGRDNYTSTLTKHEIWVFDLDSEKNETTTNYIDSSKLSKRLGKNLDLMPNRMEHCAEKYEEKMLIFSGQDSDGHRLNDLALLDLNQIIRFASNSPKEDTKLAENVNFWNILEQSNCGASFPKQGTAVLWVGLLVLILGLFTICQRYLQGSRYYGYKRLR